MISDNDSRFYEDEREEKRNDSVSDRQVIALIPVALWAAITYYFTRDFITTAIAGLTIGGAYGIITHGYYGIPRKLRGKVDPLTGRMAHKRYYRPMWLRGLALILSLPGSYYLISGSITENNYYGVAVAVASILLLIVFFGFGSWGKWFRDLKERRENRRPKTDGEIKLAEFNDSTLFSSRLASRSPDGDRVDVLPKILEKYIDENGNPAIRLEIVRGYQTYEKDYSRAHNNIASAWGVPYVHIVEGEPAKNGAHTVVITGMTRESALDGPVLWEPQEVEGKSIIDYCSSIPIGRFVSTGKVWSINLNQRNFVIGGVPGSGKSSFANALIAHLVRHPDVRVMFMDFKHGTEAQTWEKAVSTTVDNGDGKDAQDEALKLMKAINKDVAGRYSRMRSRGIVNAWEGFLGPREPLKVIVIDEISELFKSGDREQSKKSQMVLEEMKTLIQQGRAAGYVVIISTQYPTQANLPMQLKANVSDFIAFRVGNSNGTAAILGAEFIPLNKSIDPTRLTGKGQAIVRNSELLDGDKIQMSYLDPSGEAKKEVVRVASGHRKPFFDRVKKKKVKKPVGGTIDSDRTGEANQDRVNQDSETDNSGSTDRNSGKGKGTAREKRTYPAPRKQTFSKGWDD